MSLSNGVIMMWLCASTCFSGAAALKSFDVNTQTPEACKCLNWKETYDSGKAKCGDALEFFVNFVEWGTSKIGDWKSWDYRTQGWEPIEYDEMCKYLYPQLDSTRCNGLSGDKSKGNWCYVSSACSTLHGGEAVNSNVSWKHCQKGEDPDFEDVPPQELFKQGASPAVWAMYAYSSPGMLGGGGTPGGAKEMFFSDITPDQMAKFVTSGKPVFFMDSGGHTAGHVIYGQEIWRIGHAEDGGGDWATSRAVCEKGCQ